MRTSFAVVMALLGLNSEVDATGVQSLVQSQMQSEASMLAFKAAEETKKHSKAKPV
jgi:hypothetical protein